MTGCNLRTRNQARINRITSHIRAGIGLWCHILGIRSLLIIASKVFIQDFWPPSCLKDIYVYLSSAILEVRLWLDQKGAIILVIP